MNARDGASRGHRQYRTTKASAVRLAGGPTDGAPILEFWRGGEVRVAVCPRPELRTLTETLAGTGIELLIYNSDAIRRAFTPEQLAANPPQPGDQLRAFENREPGTEEVLCTVAVDGDGELAAVISPYHYERGALVFGAEEYDGLLDSSVVEDLRRGLA